MLFEEGGDLVVGQRTSEFGSAVVDFGLEVSGEFGGDVLPLGFRQPESYGGKVAIE